MVDMTSNPDGKRLVHAELEHVAGELTERVYLNNIQAVALVLIDADGDVCTRIAYQQGTKLPLLAGISILQAGMLAEMQVIAPKPVEPKGP